MTTNDRIYVNCGNYHIGDEGPNPFEQRSIANLTKAGLGHTQYLFHDSEEVGRAKSDGRGHAVDPFHLSKDGEGYQGYFDAVGGFVYADKACRYALHLAQELGVKFILDKQKGLFERFYEPSGAVQGIVTSDGAIHKAALTIIACGGWSPASYPSSMASVRPQQDQSQRSRSQQTTRVSDSASHLRTFPCGNIKSAREQTVTSTASPSTRRV